MERRGKPSTDQADHLMCPHPDRLVPLAQPFTHGQRVVARTHKKGNAPFCFVQAMVTTTAITIQRNPGLRTFRSRLESALSREWPRRLDLAAEAAFERFINHQIDPRACWDKGRDNEKQELATHREPRPAGSVEHLMKEAPVDGLGVATGAQGCCDRAASLRKPRSGEPRHQFPPRRGGTEWPKGRQNFSHGIGKGMNILLSQIWL
jgi:hypothetical protein